MINKKVSGDKMSVKKLYSRLSGISQKRNNNNIKQRKVYKAKLKSLVLIAMFMFIVLTACSIDDSTEEMATTDEVEEVATIDHDQWFPALWINGPEFVYHPIYASKTRLSNETVDAYRLYFTSLGIPFSIESNDEVQVSYKISQDNKVIEEASITPRIVQSDQSHIFDIVPDDFQNFVVNEVYNLEVVLRINGQEAYYYVDLYYSDIEANYKTVNKVYEYLKEDMKEQNISFMNVPRFWMNVTEAGIATVRSEYTGATRLDEGFDYKDYIQIAEVDIINGLIDMTGSYIVDKQRYFYSSEVEGWKLGEHQIIGDDEFDTYQRQVLSTNNNKYQVIYSDYEMYRFNVENEELEEVYRLDAFNSDYIYDEYYNHKLKVLNVDDNGDIYFAVLGYIHDGGAYNQRYGIGFYKYTNNNLVNISFIDKDEPISQLDVYLDYHTYYNSENNQMYFFEKQILYSFDLVNESFEYIDAFLKADFNKEGGSLSWQASDHKFNGAVMVMNLNQEEPEVKNLYQVGVYKRLLESSSQYIFVGEYFVEDTYEALNGQIIYPFSNIKVHDFDGQVLAEFNHEDYGDNIYFSDVYFDDSSNHWTCDLIERQFNIKESSENSRVNFVRTNGPIVLDEFSSSDKTLDLKLNEPVTSRYENLIIPALAKDKDIVFPTKAYLINSKLKINFVPYPFKDVYKIVDYKGDTLYTPTFVDALKQAKEMRDYKIYLSSYNNGVSDDELVFDSTTLLTSQYLQDVIVIPQRPELPRGCEVTSLSVLLNYYMDDAPDKMELATNLKQSSIEYEVIDGFVNYANMHYEFAGSQGDVNEPGLGVYIEPVKNLASQYSDKSPTNISGVSFEQLLTFVSNQQPVLIIIPNRYQAVADYSIQVWKTNSGYMEVTYQEHSVVVMGFDDNYVYYSDPSKGIIDKKSIESFKSAWESIGNQGLVILE